MSVPARTTSIAPATLTVAIGSATDAAGRPSNEDAVVAVGIPSAAAPSARSADEAVFLLAVADGMGGPAGGEIASALAIQTLIEAMHTGAGADVALTLKQAFRRANDAIWAQGGERGGEPMGTTLTAAVIQGKFVTIASVGDSRAYLLRGPGITQVTRDHSLVAEQITSGALKPADARSHPQRNVLTEALGTRPRLGKDLPPVYELSLLPEDRLLLCSDGFYDVLSDAELADAMRGASAAEAATALVALAKSRGTSDNVSAVVAEAIPTREPIAIPVAPAPDGARTGLLVAAIIAVLLIVAIAALFMLGVIGS